MSQVSNITNSITNKSNLPFDNNSILKAPINYNKITDIEELDLSYNSTKPTLEDIKNNTLITNLDDQISELEKEKNEIDKQIEAKKSEKNNEEWDIWELFFNHDKYKKDIEKLTKEIEKLTKEKTARDNKIKEINRLKTTNINYLTEIYYSNLKNNDGFETLSQSTNLTEEEAHQITQIYGLLYHTSFSYLVLTDKFYDYDSIYEFYKNNKDMFYGIDWKLVKNAYEKGFNIYEIAIQNTKLTEGSMAYEIFPTATLDGEYPLGTIAHLLNYMTEEEKNIVLYLYNTKGTEAVNEYLYFKQEEFNSREGLVRASEFLENINNSSDIGAFLKTALKGGGDGVGNFFEGLDNAFGGMDGVISVDQWETLYIINWISESDIDKLEGITEEEKEKLKELKGLNSNTFLQGTYEVSSSIGNMLPSMMASAAVSIVGTPAAGKIVGSILMGVSAGGNSAESVYQQGYGYYESIYYGILSGASETTLGYFLGRIPGLSLLDDSPGLKGYISDMLMEGGEEALQAIIDPYLQSIALGTEPEINWEEVKKSGIYGMITAGLLNGGKIFTTSGAISVESLSQETIDIIDNVENLGLEVDYAKISDSKYIEDLKIEIINNYIVDINKGLKTIDLTVDEVNNLFHGITNETIKYDMQKNFLDTISKKMQSGEQLTQSSYDAIFNSDMFAGDSEFAKNYLYDTIVDMGSPELAQIVKDTYQGARNATKTAQMKNLHSYCDHTEAHVLQVAFLSMNSLNTINQSIVNGNNSNGKYGNISEIDYKTILVSGLAHDLGMAAGVFNTDGKPINPAVNSWLETNSEGQVELKSEIITSETKGVDNVVRGNHTLNSALAVLKNRSLFEQIGVNPDLVALLCFSHSKSNSGVVDLTSSPDWSFSVEKIQDAVNTYNAATNNTIINFNKENLGNYTGEEVLTSSQKLINKKSGKYNTKSFEFFSTFEQKLATLGLSLRIGDAYVNKAKVILSKGQEVKWTYNGKTYSSNMLVLTQSGVYMAYDPHATIYFDNGTLNTVDTESSHYGAFMYFQKNEDGTFTPWNYKSTEEHQISYEIDSNGAFMINETNSECLMSEMIGNAEIKVEINGKTEKYKILDNGYFSKEGKYYDIQFDSTGKADITEITVVDNRYNIASQGHEIKGTTGQFLAGESNVAYEFENYTSNTTGKNYIKSNYKVGDITLFPYNTIDKGIIERVGEIATANNINRIADIIIEDSQFNQYFSVVDGNVIANSVKKNEINYGQIYIEHILKTSAKNPDIGFTINGYNIKE